MAWWNWLANANANASVDPTINWSEGESPSTINDSARAMMARSAEWRDLVSGKLVTTGTGSAYSLATLQNPPFDSLVHLDGQMVGFVPNVTNTGPVTLAVDGLTPKPIRGQTGAAGDLSAGTLIVGTPYVATYFNAVGEFILQGFTAPATSIPIGSLLFFTASTPPGSNFIFPIGQTISQTTYAGYFAMVSTTYNTGGEPGGTFRVPDLRSRMLLPLATMGGADPGRVTAPTGINAAVIGNAGGADLVTLDITTMPAHAHSITDVQHHHSIPVSPGLAGTGGAAQTTPAATTTSDAFTGITGTNNAGGGQAHNNMPPCMVMPLILRVL